jgi:hypothetical protein
MDIFGIGPLEFFLILLLTLLVFGPQDMAKAGRSLGRFLRRLVTSEEWRIITQAAGEIRHMPNRLMREAGIEEIKKDLPDLRKDADLDGLNKDLRDWGSDVSSWTKPPEEDVRAAISTIPGGTSRKPGTTTSSSTTPKTENTIKPPDKVAQAVESVKKAAPAEPAKPKFSWDEPDILPDEDNDK